MGRIFLDHIGGSRLFSCANCDTVLTNRNELVSTRFTGATGRAFLFHRAVNLVQNEIQERVMTTRSYYIYPFFLVVVSFLNYYIFCKILTDYKDNSFKKQIYFSLKFITYYPNNDLNIKYEAILFK